MKHLRIILAVAVVVMALGFSVGNVSAGKFSTYTSGIQLQNLANTPATVTLYYYNPDGSIDTTFNDPTPIAALGTRNYYPINATSGFNGSVMISSDQPIAAISNILGDPNAGGAASYVALSTGSTSLSLPLLMKGNSGYDTRFYVQNADSADASVSVSYSDGTTAGPVTVKPGASATFDQTTESHSKKVFAGTVTSDKAVVAVVLEETTKTLFAYTGFASSSTNPIMPLINANNNGNITGIQLQNAGTQSTDVTVSYTPSSSGTPCTEKQTVAAKASATFALSVFAGTPYAGVTTDCKLEKFIGSAQVTINSANQPLIAIVNQANPTSGEAYGSFDSSAASDTVVFPLIMDRNSGWFTGFSIMNVGGSATNISCTFTNTSYTFTYNNLGAGKAVVDIQQNKIANKYVGSGTCTASGGGKIVGVLNEAASISSDGLMVYEGVNVNVVN